MEAIKIYKENAVHITRKPARKSQTKTSGISI